MEATGVCRIARLISLPSNVKGELRIGRLVQHKDSCALVVSRILESAYFVDESNGDYEEIYAYPNLPKYFAGAVHVRRGLSGFSYGVALVHCPLGVALLELPVGGEQYTGVSLKSVHVAPRLFSWEYFPALDARWHPISDRCFVTLSSDGLRAWDAEELLRCSDERGGGGDNGQGLVSESLFPPRGALTSPPISLALGLARGWEGISAFVACMDGTLHCICPFLPPGAHLSSRYVDELRNSSPSVLATHWLETYFTQGGGAGDYFVYQAPSSSSDFPYVPAIQGPMHLGNGQSAVAARPQHFICDALLLPLCLSRLYTCICLLRTDGQVSLFFSPDPVAPCWALEGGGGGGVGRGRGMGAISSRQSLGLPASSMDQEHTSRLCTVSYSKQVPFGAGVGQQFEVSGGKKSGAFTGGESGGTTPLTPRTPGSVLREASSALSLRRRIASTEFFQAPSALPWLRVAQWTFSMGDPLDIAASRLRARAGTYVGAKGDEGSGRREYSGRSASTVNGEIVGTAAGKIVEPEALSVPWLFLAGSDSHPLSSEASAGCSFLLLVYDRGVITVPLSMRPFLVLERALEAAGGDICAERGEGKASQALPIAAPIMPTFEPMQALPSNSEDVVGVDLVPDANHTLLCWVVGRWRWAGRSERGVTGRIVSAQLPIPRALAPPPPKEFVVSSLENHDSIAEGRIPDAEDVLAASKALRVPSFQWLGTLKEGDSSPHGVEHDRLMWEAVHHEVRGVSETLTDLSKNIQGRFQECVQKQKTLDQKVKGLSERLARVISARERPTGVDFVGKSQNFLARLHAILFDLATAHAQKVDGYRREHPGGSRFPVYGALKASTLAEEIAFSQISELHKRGKELRVHVDALVAASKDIRPLSSGLEELDESTELSLLETNKILLDIRHEREILGNLGVY